MNTTRVASTPITDDGARFAELYQREHAEVLRFIARRLNPQDLGRAEDITHEAFLIAWRKLDDSRLGGPRVLARPTCL